MNSELIDLIEALFLPPGLLLIILFIAIVLAWRKTALFGLLCFYLLTTPYISKRLEQRLAYQHPPINVEQLHALKVDLLILLGGGHYGESLEYGTNTIGPFFAERIRYAAWLAKRSNLPILISSGKPDTQAAAEILKNQYGIQNVLTENNSWTTQDNAEHCKAFMQLNGYDKAALITHGHHMPRSVLAFQNAGVDLVPAPMGLLKDKANALVLSSWKPSPRSLLRSSTAIREYVGFLWYLGQIYKENNNSSPA